MDYTKLALPELANAIIQTERAIRRCKEILDDMRQPKGFAGSGRGDARPITDARTRFEDLGESLHQQAQVRLADAVAHHADSLGGFELDDEIKLCELLDRGRRPR
jgi:hypothetical protein